jgi:hypothetical protein
MTKRGNGNGHGAKKYGAIFDVIPAKAGIQSCLFFN